jgi:hypothetical protein
MNLSLNTIRVQRGLVVSALGCCMAAPGSILARHPPSAQQEENYLPDAGVTYPAQKERIPSTRTTRGSKNDVL